MDKLQDALTAMAAAGHASQGGSNDYEIETLRQALEAVTDLLTANYDGELTVGQALWSEFDKAVVEYDEI